MTDASATLDKGRTSLWHRMTSLTNPAVYSALCFSIGFSYQDLPYSDVCSNVPKKENFNMRSVVFLLFILLYLLWFY